MRSLAKAALVAAGLLFASPALATPLLPPGLTTLAATKSEHVQMLVAAAKLQDERAAELESISDYAGKQSKELEGHADLRDKSADKFADRSKEYADASASASDPESKGALKAFSKELAVFAKHDKDMAKERRAAAKTFAKESDRAAQWAKDHRAAAEKLRTLADKLKNKS